MVNKSAGWPTGHYTSYFPIILVCQWAVLFWLILYFLNYKWLRLKTGVTILEATEMLNDIQVEYIYTVE